MIASPHLAEKEPTAPPAQMRTLTLDASVYAALDQALQIPEAAVPQDPSANAAPPQKPTAPPDPSSFPPIENLRVVPWEKPHGTPIV